MQLMELIKELETMETNADLKMDITGVYNDSRKVQPGGLFVAISGAAQDGHIYIPKALANGASVVVTEQPLHDMSIPFIVVPDTKLALGQLDAAFMGHPSREMTMVGITGTNGKTTVAHLIYGLLSKKPGCKPALLGTNHILYDGKELPSERTTPDAVELHSLFRRFAGAGCTHCVMEVSSHAIEQKRTAAIEYEVGLFTNLTQDHLDYHQTMEDYFAAKARLFAQCRQGAVNADDPYGARLLEQYNTGTFAINASAELRAEDVRLTADGVTFTAVWRGARATLHWGTPGRFTVYNVLAAAYAALKLGMELTDIAAALPGIPPVCGRMEVVKTPGAFTVLLDYAHTPDALENVLTTARSLTDGAIITVFGCGGDRDSSKRPLMGGLAERLSDRVIVTNDNPRTEDPGRIISDILAGMENAQRARVEPDRRKAIHLALSEAQPGDIIMICGKGHEMYQEIGLVKYPMDEREIIAAYGRPQYA